MVVGRVLGGCREIGGEVVPSDIFLQNYCPLPYFSLPLYYYYACFKKKVNRGLDKLALCQFQDRDTESEFRAQAVGNCDERCKEEAYQLGRDPDPCVHLQTMKGKAKEVGFGVVKSSDHSVYLTEVESPRSQTAR